jgi:hypothetical protein
MLISKAVQQQFDELGVNRDAEHLPLLRDVSCTPVFIIAMPRSGGTLLYDLFRNTGAFNIMTTYDLLCYDSLLANHLEGKSEEARNRLDALLTTIGGTTREIDNIAFSAQMPEEYSALLIKKVGHRYISERSFPYFDELSRKLQFTSSRPGLQTLHRNPYDYQHFATIHKFYPQAKFVFLHRHPFRILNSQLKALQSISANMPPYYQLTRINQMRPLRRKVFQSPTVWKLINKMVDPNSRFALGQKLNVLHILNNARYYFRKIGSLPQSNYVSIRYEDLCTAPNETMRRMLEFLGVPFPEGVDFAHEISPRPCKYVPTIERNRKALLKTFAEIIQGHHYTDVDDQK